MKIILLVLGLALVVSALALAYYAGKIKAMDEAIEILEEIDTSRK